MHINISVAMQLELYMCRYRHPHTSTQLLRTTPSGAFKDDHHLRTTSLRREFEVLFPLNAGAGLSAPPLDPPLLRGSATALKLTLKVVSLLASASDDPVRRISFRRPAITRQPITEMATHSTRALH